MCAWSGGKERARSITKTAKFLGITEAVLKNRSARCRWQVRASAYDAHMIAQHATGALSELADMRERQNRLLNDGMRVLELSIERLKGALEGGKTAKGAEALKAIKLDVPKFMDTLLKYQNLLYGQATEKVAATVEFGAEWDLSALTVDELRTLNAIRAKCKPKGDA